MRVARIAVIVAAVLAGLFALILVRSMGKPKQVAVTQPVPNIETVEVLTASDDIEVGATLTADKLNWTEWPELAASSGYIKRDLRPDADDQLVGAIARSSFLKGEPINEGKLALAGSGLMASMLAKGYRAVAISISAESSAGGFILPRDHVDVIMSMGRSGKVQTKTILTNVRVLAIDQTIEDQDGEKVVVGETATLELLPRQSEALISAQMQGELSLVLRSLEDAKGDDEQQDMDNGTITVVRSGLVSKRTVQQ